MASLKALMSQRKAQAQLSHPFAKYDTASRLSCSLCGLAIKHENLFAAHLTSKQHRVNKAKWDKEQAVVGKRKRDEEEGGRAGGGKRARDDGDDEEDEGAPGGLPADFFADPSQAPLPTAGDEDENATSTSNMTSEATADPIASTSSVAPATATDVDSDAFDAEWASFEATLAAPASASTAQATIFAAPVLYEFGAPKVQEEGEEDADEEGQGDAGEEEETEAEKRARIDREEREEIMERITEEEREQMEADEKVAVRRRRVSLSLVGFPSGPEN